MAEEEAMTLVLSLLSSAAEFNSATGGIDYEEGNVYPIVKRITRKECPLFPLIV